MEYPPSDVASSFTKFQDDASSISSTDSDYLMDLGDSSYNNETVLPKSDPHSPFFISVPIPNQAGLLGNYSDSNTDLQNDVVREYPTDILLDRFTKWRKILKGLIVYLREVAYAQEQFARINFQIRSAVKFPFLTDLEENTNRLIDPLLQKPKRPTGAASSLNKVRSLEDDTNAAAQEPNATDPARVIDASDSSASSGFMKFGSGSIQDIQVILKKHHLSMAGQQLKTSKELTAVVIPRLEDLRRDLQAKIKEIKDLHGDFRTNISEHVALTGQLLQKYTASVKFLSTQAKDGDVIKLKKDQHLKPKHDPYLLKLQLDLQLKRQLLEENYLQEAYINLQSSAMELEKIIYGEIQHTLQKYSALVDSLSRASINNLCMELQRGLLSKPPACEWDHFVCYHPKCLIKWKSTEPVPQPRKLSDIRYPKMKSPLAKCIRAGYLLKKSKILKNYNKGYFVLTSNYLHEFKGSNFFKSQDSGEKKDHGEVQAGHKKRAMLPIMSLPLNDSVLVESTSNKFTLHGLTTFNNIDRKTSTETGKIISKSTSSIGKFLKATGPKTQQSKKHQHQMRAEDVDDHKPALQESEKVTTWDFKTVGHGDTQEDARDFKKWVGELRNLTSFNNNVERAKFIEDKILRAHSRAASSLSLLKNVSDSSTVSLSRIPSSTTTLPRANRSNRPDFINLGPQTFADPAAARAKVNTPAIDDHGNLITTSGKTNLSLSGLSLASPKISPASTPHSQSSPGRPAKPDVQASGDNLEGYFGFKQIVASPHHPNVSPPLVVSPPAKTSTSVSPSGIPQRPHGHHERHVSSTSAAASEANSDQSSTNAPINSPGSTASAPSGGGYFAIPVRKTSQNSTPGSVQIEPIAFPGESASHIGVPRVRVNDQDVHGMLPSSAESPSLNRTKPAYNLKKTGSAGSVPTVEAEGVHSVYKNTKLNNSGHSLVSGKSQALRKHRKNVSFGSLNNLLFSKRTGEHGIGSVMTDHSFSATDNKHESQDSGAINVHRSLYS
ncbi:LAMI_0H05622g1_1 [Lachancea mirantina]|uniref:LAMI_0H05622g1_1 n=1 Tax=Lachancea mirantina TaxID=1230905 RepID=A0A1G4KEY9_9SACH|nr:LAMI_0H05622g1_1 [Lachancea mirantina]